jgi:Ser/Thr protein kinase RdoA (MazF antagonist)
VIETSVGSRQRLEAVASRFALPGPVVAIRELGTGNVNDTYLVTVRPAGKAEKHLVLQRINTRVFSRPDLVMGNILRLGDHVEALRRRGARRAARRWEVPRALPALDGVHHWVEEGGDVWRTITFVEGSRSFDTIGDPAQAREVGLGLGQFHALISDLPVAELADTLEGFHVTPGYLAQFQRVLRRTAVPLTPQAQHCIAFIRAREAFVSVLEDAKAAGRLPLRPIHGDPKINNVMMDVDSGAAIALVDLDTVKPGLVHYDIGDCLRSGCNRLGEETDDWRSVQFDLTLCEALLEGYGAVAHQFLTPADYDHLFDAIRLIAFELGLRFFTDHLAGDVYFKISRPGHNLQRALVQFRLTESIEAQAPQIRAIVERLRLAAHAVAPAAA